MSGLRQAVKSRKIISTRSTIISVKKEILSGIQDKEDEL
jgi:hypothetical protein